jgi:hypothetical protein
LTINLVDNIGRAARLNRGGGGVPIRARRADRGPHPRGRLGIFLVGCFITAIVAGACWLVVTGIRADQHEREDRTVDESSKRAEGISG